MLQGGEVSEMTLFTRLMDDLDGSPAPITFTHARSVTCPRIPTHTRT